MGDVTPVIGRTPDRIAVCQHPRGAGSYVPAEHIVDGRCFFIECDCSPRVYVPETEVEELRAKIARARCRLPNRPQAALDQLDGA